jgi:hypothetical protein
VAANDLFEVAREAFVKSGRAAMLSGQSQRFREQPDARFGAMKDGDGFGMVFDDEFRTGAHPFEQRSEVARRFGFRDVDHVLAYAAILPLLS